MVARYKSLEHSAHVGQEVEIQYRWHPLFRRQVRCHYTEHRTIGQIAHVEISPGVVIVVPAWMLDQAACAGMELGTQRINAIP